MESLSPEARARLAAFRRAESPSDADAERCLAAVEQRLAAAPPATTRRRVALYTAAALALAAGLLVALRLAGTPARSDDPAALQAPYQDSSDPPASQARDATPGPAPTLDPPPPTPNPSSPSIDPATANPSAPIIDPSTPTTNPSAPIVDPPTTNPPAPSTPGEPPVPQARRPRGREADIAAEVALLRAAKLAAPARRLELLADHARRFPDGTFAAERSLLEVETRCELGEAATARALAARFIQRFRGSPLAARVAKICAEEPAAP